MRGPHENRKNIKTEKYHYCSYWRKWSRVLQWAEGALPQIEVDIEPVNPEWSHSWNKTKKINIRRHYTAPSNNDIDSDDLPLKVTARMIENLGEEITNRILTEDFLPQIDWNLYRKKCNGGAALNEIRKCA